MKKSIILLSAVILFILPVMSYATTGQIVATNSPSTTFYDFTSPPGQYITQITGIWSAGVGHIDVHTNGGSSGTIMITQDVQIYFNGITVTADNHILQMGPDGPEYLGAWSESGSAADIIYNFGSSYAWNFTNFTSPSCEVITGFTASSAGGWAYLNAVSSEIVDTLVSQSGIILTANATGASYQWIYCNTSLPVSGQTNQSFTPTANGNYAVIVTQNSCSDTSTCHAVTTVGIPDNSNDNAITIFPNPSSGKFLIEMGNRKTQAEDGFIEIYNLPGERIYSANIKQQKSHEIDLSNYPIGMYFIKIYTGEKFYTEMIVIQ